MCPLAHRFLATQLRPLVSTQAHQKLAVNMIRMKKEIVSLNSRLSARDALVASLRLKLEEAEAEIRRMKTEALTAELGRWTTNAGDDANGIMDMHRGGFSGVVFKIRLES